METNTARKSHELNSHADLMNSSELAEMLDFTRVEATESLRHALACLDEIIKQSEELYQTQTSDGAANLEAHLRELVCHLQFEDVLCQRLEFVSSQLRCSRWQEIAQGSESRHDSKMLAPDADNRSHLFRPSSLDTGIDLFD